MGELWHYGDCKLVASLPVYARALKPAASGRWAIRPGSLELPERVRQRDLETKTMQSLQKGKA